MQNEGVPSYSLRGGTGRSFDDFDPDTLLNEPFLDDLGEKLEHAASRMDIGSEETSTVELELEQSHQNFAKKTRKQNCLHFESQSTGLHEQSTQPTPSDQLQRCTPASDAFVPPRHPSTDFYPPIQQSNQHQDSSSAKFIPFSLEPVNHSNAVTSQGLTGGAGHLLFHAHSNENPHLAIPRLTGASPFSASPSMNSTQTRIKAKNLGDPTSFDRGNLQGVVERPNNSSAKPQFAAMEQDGLPSSTNLGATNLGVSMQQLEVMEKLCESMKRSAMTRSIIKQLSSNRSIDSQVTTNRSIDSNEELTGRLKRERSPMSRRLGARLWAPGRGHTRGITVSGRGFGRRASSKNRPNAESLGLKVNEQGSSSSLSSCMFPRQESMPSLTKSDSFHSMESSGHERSRFKNIIHQEFRGVSGLQRHCSNHSMLHNGQHIEEGPMDMSFQ